jgi:hypothetical protein
MEDVLGTPLAHHPIATNKMGYFKVLKWQFLPAVICFNLAYFISYVFPLWCFALVLTGIAQLFYGYYNSISVSFSSSFFFTA